MVICSSWCTWAYAWEDLVMSKINPPVAARNNVQNRRKHRRSSSIISSYFWITTYIENEIYAELFPRFFLFLLLYWDTPPIKTIRKYLYSNVIPSALLIDISIPNVNIDTPSASIWHMESRVSRTSYREKVYERRGGEDITYANYA